MEPALYGHPVNTDTTTCPLGVRINQVPLYFINYIDLNTSTSQPIKAFFKNLEKKNWFQPTESVKLTDEMTFVIRQNGIRLAFINEYIKYHIFGL